jgi:hypothetical protein
VKGQQSFLVPRYIIKRVVTLPKRYAAQYPSDNIGHQFTMAQLQLIEKFPDSYKVRVPTTGAWLKMATGTSPQPGGKEQVLDEWWHAPFWDNLHYPPAVAPAPAV